MKYNSRRCHAADDVVVNWPTFMNNMTPLSNSIPFARHGRVHVQSSTDYNNNAALWTIFISLNVVSMASIIINWTSPTAMNAYSFQECNQHERRSCVAPSFYAQRYFEYRVLLKCQRNDFRLSISQASTSFQLEIKLYDLAKMHEKIIIICAIRRTLHQPFIHRVVYCFKYFHRNSMRTRHRTLSGPSWCRRRNGRERKAIWLETGITILYCILNWKHLNCVFLCGAQWEKKLKMWTAFTLSLLIGW